MKKSEHDRLRTLRVSEYRNGKEIFNPEPIEAAAPGRETLHQRVKRYLRNEFDMIAHERGVETEEEANDFDVQDQFEEMMEKSPYEVQELAEEIPDSYHSEKKIVEPARSESVENEKLDDDSDKNRNESKNQPED